jgi:uncharacterized protein GlcG (DUF336 family)
MSARLAIALAFAVLLGACSGGGGSSSSSPPATAAQSFLTTDDVKQVIAQAAGEAQARGVAAHVAVVDRVGNVLAIFRMTGAGTTTVISSGLGVTGGLEGASVSSMDAAVAKAITAAYLSSNGNAFTTRTASQIIQEHFNPGEARQPSGPLYGVQFSQLACSDVIESTPGMRNGPRPSPLGLAADPGGLPLYKSGVLVGGVGIEADNVYGIDRDIHDVDANVEEALAVAGSFGFEAPADIRADRITADGRTLRFVDSVSLAADPARAPAFAALPGDLVGLVPYNLVTLSAGTVFGSDESGVRPASMDRAGPWVLVDASGGDRFPARGTPQQHIPTSGLTQAEVEAVLADAYAVARRARGQIRRPLGSSAEVSIAVVSARGVLLGLIRTPDAPLFGIDVAVQKARTALFALGDAASPRIAAARAFVGPAFDATAWSSRAIGNLHRPSYPDGIDGTPPGPFSTSLTTWSPFNVGLQQELVQNQLLNALNADVSKNCGGGGPTPGSPREESGLGVQNGIQIFAGGIPIYRGSERLGAIGVSGDGVDQDDMVAFLGLANAGRRLGTGIGNAPAEIRADTLTPQGTRLRYVQCPQSPFLDSAEENVCAGL